MKANIQSIVMILIGVTIIILSLSCKRLTPKEIEAGMIKWCVQYCQNQGKSYISPPDEIGAPIEGCVCEIQK